MSSKSLLLYFLILFTPLLSHADDAVFLVSPENQATFKNDEKSQIIDFALTQKIQKQFFDMLELLKKNKIKIILANGRPESSNCFNNNWFFIYSLNNSRILTTLPQIDVNESNFRPDYVKHLLNQNSYQINKINNFTKQTKHIFNFDYSQFVLDRNHRHMYLLLSDNEPLDHLINSFSKDLGITHSLLKVKSDMHFRMTDILNTAERLAMVCSDCFETSEDYIKLKEELMAHNKTIIEITRQQAEQNVTDYLVLKVKGVRYVVINKMAIDHLTDLQMKLLFDYGKVIVVDLAAFYQYNKTRLIDMLTLIN